MDANRFDALAASLAGGEASRRSVLGRIAGGGIAALLAAFGIGGVGVDEAEARRCRRCRRKKTKAKRRRCRRRCRQQQSAPQCTGTGECPGTQICVRGACVDRPAEPESCTVGGGECDGGLICSNNICVLGCEDNDDCDFPLICLGDVCVLDDECDPGEEDCGLLETCLLGLCVDLEDQL